MRAAAIALGLLQNGVRWNASTELVVMPIVGVAVLVALLLQRRQYSRADRDEAVGWRLADEVRPLRSSVARLPLVRLMRWGTAAAIVVGLASIPILLRTDQIIKANAVIVFAVTR